MSTTAVWSPVLPKDRNIPASVSIATGNGDVMHATIEHDAARYTRIMQLNVYLLSDVLGRAVNAPLPPMSAPVEPGKPGDLAHDVHHNVHAAYEAARATRGSRRGPVISSSGFRRE